MVPMARALDAAGAAYELHYHTIRYCLSKRIRYLKKSWPGLQHQTGS
jgi:hypothetical protein